MALVVHDRRKPLELAIRKFIFGSYRVFEDIERRADDVQKEAGDTKHAATEMRAVLFRGSRLFRDQISTLLFDIDLLQSTFFNENNSEYLFQAEYDLAAYLGTTWHLCEIFFLNHTNSNSLEIIQWFQMNGVPSVDVDSNLGTFRSVLNPQLIEQSATDDVNGFWECVFALVLEGKLADAWEVISLHREVSDIIASGERNNTDRNVLEAIHDVMNSHPYVHLVSQLNTNNDDNESASIPPSITLEFTDWQEKVSRILQSDSSLLGRIGELSTVLLMLVGDKDTLVEQSRGEWTTLGVGLFLYVYPPPLMRANISKIVESVMKMAVQRIDTSPEERQKETRQREKMCSIMNGDASFVLISLVEVCGWGNSLVDFCSLFGLISVSHLTYLLAKSGVSAATLTAEHNSDILGELLGGGKAGNLSATFPNETPFVEELFLESVQRLNELQFPLEIVSGYLRACPLRGVEHARILLPKRRITSDSTVHSICRTLRSFGLSAEAKALEASRGSWWLQQSDRNGSTFGSGGKVVKALQFYQRAGDLDRTYALLDRTLWRCCTALVNASQALYSSGISSSGSTHDKKLSTKYLFLIPRNLKIYPVPPRGASVLGVTSSADHWDLRHYVEASGGEAEEVALDMAVQRLFSAVGDAEELLGAIITTDTLNSPEAIALKVFVGVIRALLTVTLPVVEKTEWTSSLNLTQGLVGIPLGDWKSLNQLGGVLLEGEEAEKKWIDVLRFAADSVCGLMGDELAPMRFWLPLLELCVGLDSLIDRKRCPCLYSKAQAYSLLESAERVVTVHSHYNLLPNTGNTLSSTASTVKSSEIEEENHRSLRLLLLGILSGSVIQAHADAGYTKVKNDDEIRAAIITDFQRLKTPIEKVKRQNALEMLSVSAFL